LIYIYYDAVCIETILQYSPFTQVGHSKSIHSYG